MRNIGLIWLGKLGSKISKQLHLGHGSTWPGHIALRLNPNFVKQMLKDSSVKIIFIAGTNGKTTSARMLRTILEADGKRVIHNESGANLLNGIASILLLKSSLSGKFKADYAIFEVDENILPRLVKEISPSYILLLNLFRDQLDRYGEVDTIAAKWQNALNSLPEKTVLVANADDPRIAYLGMQRKNTIFFGLTTQKKSAKELKHAVDSTYCPKCGTKLTYKTVYYSHLGDWYCPHCTLKRPDISISKDINISLSGTYNLSNAHGIIALSRQLGTLEGTIAKALEKVTPAFGRQEKIIIKDKVAQLFLSKNPTGFNESLRTISELGAKHILLILNDRIADGRDVSWIWDIDFEPFLRDFNHITISGDRTYDMGLRLKYTSNEPMANSQWQIEENLEKALHTALSSLPKDEMLYILPTYTAMLEVRKILTGKKIL